MEATVLHIPKQVYMLAAEVLTVIILRGFIFTDIKTATLPEWKKWQYISTTSGNYLGISVQNSCHVS